MVYPHVEDEYDEAMAPASTGFHGQISTAAFRIAWPKGDFKARQVYDLEIHKGDNWQTGVMINITITPLDPTRKLITREVMNFSREFVGVMRPSLGVLNEAIAKIRNVDPKVCNPLREVNGLWVSGEFVARPDNKPGDTWTTLKITGVWATEAECAAHAATAQHNGDAQTPPVEAPKATDAQRQALAAFLPTLWNQAGRNMEQFQALLSTNPMLSIFTPDSPEVKEVCVA